MAAACRPAAAACSPPSTPRAPSTHAPSSPLPSSLSVCHTQHRGFAFLFFVFVFFPRHGSPNSYMEAATTHFFCFFSFFSFQFDFELRMWFLVVKILVSGCWRFMMNATEKPLPFFGSNTVQWETIQTQKKPTIQITEKLKIPNAVEH